MKRALINYIVDIPLLILTVLEGVSGLILQFGGRGMSEWRHIHELCGVSMVILFVIHLALHWRWVVCVTKSTFGLNKKNAVQTCSTE
ncbi:MAG: hypothetical protein A4E23_01134 [Methanomethylovorans sp. PtaU1.Bin073]|nr:MAG: hypothetical protein A4E23_01134 [Methanomethylovorans sp. PtaU1.Bin073]